VLPIFIIDSGATHSMSYERQYFTDMKPLRVPITVGNGNVIFTNAIGNIGNLKNVYYVPHLKYNLLSVAHLNDHGFAVQFNLDQSVTISDNYGTTKLIGYFDNGLFRTSTSTILCTNHTSLYTTALETNTLWHNRLAHVNDMYINIAITKSLITGINLTRYFKSLPCDACILSKSTRIPSTKTPGSAHRVFKKTVHFTNSNPVDNTKLSTYSTSAPYTSGLFINPDITIIPPCTKLVTDIKGPIANGTKKYCLLFTCVTTRYRFGYYLKNKDETIKCTQHLILYLRKLLPYHTTILPMSELKSDNGTEFINSDMKDLLN
jgi:hypothetical protein